MKKRNYKIWGRITPITLAAAMTITAFPAGMVNAEGTPAYGVEVNVEETDLLGAGNLVTVDGKTYYYEDGQQSTLTDVVKIGNDWYNLVDGLVTPNTVAKNALGWWYIDRTGRVDFTYTGIAKNNNGWWRIENGKVNFFYNGLAKNENGWFYLKNGKVDFSYTGTATNSLGKWLVVSGKVQFGTGLYSAADRLYYLVDGIVEASTNYSKLPASKYGDTQATDLEGLTSQQIVQKMGPVFTQNQKDTGILASVSMAQFILESGWASTSLALTSNNCFGMKATLSSNSWGDSSWDGASICNKLTTEEYSGKIVKIYDDFRAYGSIEDSIYDHAAYLIGAKNGSKQRYAGLVGCTDYKTAITIIKNGGYATDSKYVSSIVRIIEQYNLTQFDVKNGLVDSAAEDGKWYYYVDNEIAADIITVAKNKNGWWYVKNGAVDFSYTGIAKNSNGWWRIENGKVNFNYTGLAKNENGWFYLKNGKVDFTCNDLVKNSLGWWYVKDGKVDFTYTGLAQNSYGWWYLQDGKVNFDYSGTVSFNGKSYEVVNGKASY